MAKTVDRRNPAPVGIYGILLEIPSRVSKYLGEILWALMLLSQPEGIPHITNFAEVKDPN